MPKLICNVGQCAYNTNSLCKKQSIDIDGPNSKSKKETTCKNYIFKDVETFNYEFAEFKEPPKLNTEVYCDAVNCVFEKDQKCYADRIEIKNITNEKHVGYKQANRKDITHCQTFESKD